MNTTPDARIGHIIAGEAVQTVLLIIVSVVATWLCPFRIPWQVSLDPCLIATGATVIIVVNQQDVVAAHEDTAGNSGGLNLT